MVPAPIFKMANELAKTKPVKLKNTFKHDMHKLFYCKTASPPLRSKLTHF